MYIKEVCQRCGITKKAVEYYEKLGFIQPKIGENGYRIYEEEELRLLKEIVLFRRLNLSLKEIKSILHSPVKAASLEQLLYKRSLQRQKIEEEQQILTRLKEHYDIDEAYCILENRFKVKANLQERILDAFPGYLGLSIAIHFKGFLDEPIDSPEKEAAYQRIITFLEGLDQSQMPQGMLQFFMEAGKDVSFETMEKIASERLQSLEHFEDFLHEHREGIEAYLDYRNSADFHNSEVWRAQQELQEFFIKSGYYEHFIPNLKIISRKYRQYVAQLEAANEEFLKRFPRAHNQFSPPTT